MTWERIDDYWGFGREVSREPTAYLDSVQAVLMKETAAHLAADAHAQDRLPSACRAPLRSPRCTTLKTCRPAIPSCSTTSGCSAPETVAGFAVTKERSAHPRAPRDANGSTSRP